MSSSIDYFHGTKKKFSRISLPIPKNKKSPAEYQSGLFFTPDMNYAKSVGDKILHLKIKNNSNILDFNNNYSASESVRKKLLLSMPCFKNSINSEHDKWHNGWIDGSVLRLMITDEVLIQSLINNEILKHKKSKNFSIHKQNDSFCLDLAIHNLTRGFIENICKATKKCGFDGAVGNEINRWGTDGQLKDMFDYIPFLVLFNIKPIDSYRWIG